MDFICEQLKIKEKDYFGLRYVDASKQRVYLKSHFAMQRNIDLILQIIYFATCVCCVLLLYYDLALVGFVQNHN